MASDDRLRELEEKYEDYKVYDNQGGKIGKVDDLFIDESNHEEYIGVKLGLFGMRSTLIPMDIVRVNETDRTIEVSETKEHVKDAPNFDDDDDITTEYEERIRSHFGLESHSSSRGGYGSSSTDSSTTGAGTGAVAGTAAGASAGATGEREAAHDEEPQTTEHHSPETDADDTDRLDRPVDERAETHETPYSYESGEHAEGETSQGDSSEGLGSSGSTLGEGDTQGTPISRQTEETETFKEDGRTKIRRRIVREEVEDAEPGTDSTQ